MYQKACFSMKTNVKYVVIRNRKRVGIAVKNPETIDIKWFQGLLFADRTKSVLQVLL